MKTEQVIEAWENGVEPYRFASMSVGDFKAHIAKIKRAQNGEGNYSVIGAAPAHPCVVRNNGSEAAQ